uniref:Proactivator polypeptide-like 1 n=1 Tax=Equus asinus asinus TaxID=83772 RepID=A0A8C4L6A5_EQUAS
MLQALLPLLGLLGAALTSPVSGPQECAKGPAVWCQDLQVATRCGAVGHCQSAIWSKPTAKTLPCDVCLDVAAASSHGLNPDATETDILQTLRLAPPKEICRKRGFCEELREPALLAHTIQMKSLLTCEVCLEVVQELDQWLESNSTETMISHTLERVCSKMPAPIVQQCVTLVDTYSPSLVQLVASVAPEKVCKAIRLCRSQRRARKSDILVGTSNQKRRRNLCKLGLFQNIWNSSPGR